MQDLEKQELIDKKADAIFQRLRLTHCNWYSKCGKIYLSKGDSNLWNWAYYKQKSTADWVSGQEDSVDYAIGLLL